jgi:hypothetical protein
MCNYLKGVTKPPEAGIKRAAAAESDEDDDRSKKKRLYQRTWEQDHPWVFLDESSNSMKCRVSEIK